MADVKATPPTLDLRDRAKNTEPSEPGSAFDPPHERFEMLGELGRGGMGRVTDAYDRALRRPVAIKEMLSASGVDLARFEREARITARLEHPGIVPIHDAGRSADGTPFYVMRRVDGQPLDVLIERTASGRAARGGAQSAIAIKERLALIPNVLAACDAVAFAHARGVVHRDIKPTNILVGPFGETLVIDWGIAREIVAADPSTSASIPASEPQLTRAGTVAGTPGFMAPEQARGEAVDARADVFALGATLFYVISGQLPYGTSSATEMVDLVGAGRDPDWRRLPRDAPPELRAIARKAMASRSDERYPDAGALATDLRQFITGNLVAAYDYGPVTRLVRFVRRHRAAVAVAAISALIVLGVAVLAVRRIVFERDDANVERKLAQAAAARLLVRHARELADTDPVSAIMVLRTIGANPETARDAWAAAAAAYVHGIPFGFNSDMGGHIQISNDNRHALVSSWQGDSVTLLDLVDHTSRVVTSRCESVGNVVWLGPDHAVCNGTPVRIVDLRTGTVRTLDIHALQIWGDRGSRVRILDQRGTVVELDDPDGAPRTIATAVDEAAATEDFSVALFRRGSTWEVRTPTKTFELPIHEAHGIGFVSADRVAIYANTKLRQWRIEHDTAIDDWTYVEPYVMSVVLLGERTFVATPRGITLVMDGKNVNFDPTPGLVLTMPNGLAQIADDGSLRIYDGTGWLRLQRKASGLRMADVSPDGQRVVASTSSGEILTWDLHSVFPVRAIVPVGYGFLRLTPRALWMWSVGDGVSRLDLATHKVEKVIDRPATIYGFASHEDTWAAATDLGHDLLIADLTTGKHIRAVGAEIAVDDRDGLTFTHEDGTVWRWRPGSAIFHQVGSLGGRAETLTSVPDWVVATVGHQLVRLDPVTRIVERIDAPPGDLEMLQVAPAGMVWILAAHAVWGWAPRSHMLTRVPTAESIASISADEHGLVMATARAITTVVDGVAHVTPVASATPIFTGVHRAVVVNDRGEMSMIDLRTGFAFTLPERSIGDATLATEDTVVAITNILAHDQMVVSLWRITVPSDPLALEAWLGTITNAQAVGASEVYAWPR